MQCLAWLGYRKPRQVRFVGTFPAPTVAHVLKNKLDGKIAERMRQYHETFGGPTVFNTNRSKME